MNLLSGLRRVVQVYGDDPAIYTSGRMLTYREFYERILQAGAALRELGIEKGDRLAVLMLNSPRYLELYYATAAIGAAIVPLNTRWNIDEIARTLNDSGSRMLVVDDRFASVPAQLHRKAHLATALYAGEGACPNGMVDYEESLRRGSSGAVALHPEIDENDLAGIFYTSGTTGGPKGAMLTHRNLVANAHHAILEFGVSRDWIWLHSAPMFHMANGGSMYALTIMGAAHCFIPAFEPEAFLQAVERYRITSALLVPTMLNMVLHHPTLRRCDTSSLRFLLYGASPMPVDLLRKGMETFGCRFFQGYGMTETGPLLTVLHPEDHSFDSLDGRFAPVRSAGRAIVGVEVRVVDEQDRDLPPGEPGEIIARGPNVMKGYWKRPEITAEILRGGWMHTGDIGTFDRRGFLYILDRKKDMIKTGSENVYTPEVESVLYSHPGVLEAAVIGVPDEKWGEVIKAVVVLRSATHLTENQLIAFCRERLTHFKCPTSLHFTDALPKSATGKIQKNVLREQYGKKEMPFP